MMDLSILKAFVPTITKAAVNSAWRPYYAVATLAAYTYQLFAVPILGAPALDQSMLNDALLGLGGLGILRTTEKVKGV